MSDETLFRSIFPVRYRNRDPDPPAYVLVIVNWLLFEVDMHIEEKLPLLREIAGHRRREVVRYMDAQPDWTAGILNTKMVV
jgi:hypothetical protein